MFAWAFFFFLLWPPPLPLSTASTESELSPLTALGLCPHSWPQQNPHPSPVPSHPIPSYPIPALWTSGEQIRGLTERLTTGASKVFNSAADWVLKCYCSVDSEALGWTHALTSDDPEV